MKPIELGEKELSYQHSKHKRLEQLSQQLLVLDELLQQQSMLELLC
jgi:hypothetical protein